MSKFNYNHTSIKIHGVNRQSDITPQIYRAINIYGWAGVSEDMTPQIFMGGRVVIKM